MPSVSTSLVLARPGTPTSSAWPPASSATSVRSTTLSWPKMTLADARADLRNVGQRLLGLGDHVLLVERGFLDHDAHAGSILRPRRRPPDWRAVAATPAMAALQDELKSLAQADKRNNR